MRVLWTEIKYIKCAARLLDRNFVNKRGLDLSKEVVWVSVGQRSPELRVCQSWTLKKSAALPGAGKAGSNLAARQNFFLTSNFDGW